MALAHQISLIDLSGIEFADLRQIVDDLGEFLYNLEEEDEEPSDEDDFLSGTNSKGP